MLCLSQGCTRGAVLFMVLPEALLGDAPHSCSESMATLTTLPAAAQQQVQLLQEQGEEQQDAPKQHICQGRLQRLAGLVCPLLPSSCSSCTSAVSWMGCPCTREAPARMRDSCSKHFIFYLFKGKATKAQQPLAVRRKCCEHGNRKLCSAWVYPDFRYADNVFLLASLIAAPRPSSLLRPQDPKSRGQ